MKKNINYLGKYADFNGKSMLKNLLSHISLVNNKLSKQSSDILMILFAAFLICGCASVKSTSPETRMKALNKTTNVNKLYRIVVNKRLNDDVREAALKKLPQSLIGEMLFDTRCDEVLKIKAIKLVDNQSILYKVAVSRYDNLAEIAIKSFSQSNLKNYIMQEVLNIHNYNKDNIDLVKRKNIAVDCLDGSDQNLLCEIVLNTKNDNNRNENIRIYEKKSIKSAVSKISQHDLLAKLAMESNSDYIRLAVIDRIDDSDQELLYEIALNDHNIIERSAAENIKKSAVSKIFRRDLLEKLILESKIDYIRLGALHNVDDSEQELLYEIACNSSGNVASKALNKLSESSISKLFDESKNITVIENAIRYVDNLDQNLIYKVALMNDDNLARVAVGKLSRSELLAKVVGESKMLDIRLLAINNLKDQAELIKIVQKKDKYEITKAAYKKLDEKSLAFLAKNAKDLGVALAAKISLKEVSWDTAFSKNRNVTLGNVIGAAALVDNPKPTASSVVEACHTYIRRGDASRIPELRTLLLDYGDKSLAEDYLNCGKAELEEAAREWARRKGYSVGGGYGSNRVRWGGR